MKIVSQRDFKFMVPMSLMSYSSLVVVLGLWGAPYLKDIQGLNSMERGQVLMLMAISWNIGSFVFGYLSKVLGGYKRVVIFGASGTIIFLLIISFIPILKLNYLFILFSIFGFFGAFSVALISHYQSLHDKIHMGKALTTANFLQFWRSFFNTMDYRKNYLFYKCRCIGCFKAIIYVCFFICSFLSFYCFNNIYVF